MSTYMYLTCESHSPALRAEEESGQHLYDLARIREQIADRERLVAEWEADEYQRYSWSFENNTTVFLATHKTCEIGIVDEYGRDYPVVEEPDADIGDMELTLTVRAIRQIKAEVFAEGIAARGVVPVNPYLDAK